MPTAGGAGGRSARAARMPRGDYGGMLHTEGKRLKHRVCGLYGRGTFYNAPNHSKMGLQQVFWLIGRPPMRHHDMSIISLWFLPLLTFSTLREGSQVGYNFGIWTRKNNTFYFTASFRCLRVNKSALETTETKHTDSQLCFAPKIIKIHLVGFENELFEVA